MHMADNIKQQLKHSVQYHAKKIWFKINRLLPTHIPIAYKLAIIITLLISTGMILLGLVIVTNQTQLLKGQMHDYGRTVSSQLAGSSKELILSDDILSLMVLVKNLGTNTNIQGAVIYSEAGRILASTGILPNNDITKLYSQSEAIKDNDYTFEWQKTTVNKNDPQNTSTTQLDLISFITPIKFQDIIAGHTVVTFSKESLSRSITETVHAILAATIFMILLGIFTAYELGKRLSRPIHHLMNASKAIDKGDYSFRIDERRNDEIGYLIDSFNNMATGLLEKNQVENAFSRFVSTNVAKQIMENLDGIQLGGEHVEATALFADIVGFTSMSERLHPEEVANMLNEYFTYISMASQLYNGTIDKYMGDCAMVVFGAPQPDADHKLNAICCAILIQRLVEKLNVQRIKAGKQAIHFRIGVNSGEMLAGNMGSNDRMQYTVVGEAVNLASRLHTAAKHGQIIISDYMVQDSDVQWNIVAHRHESIELRGIAEPVTTYVVTDLKPPYSDMINQHIDNILEAFDIDEAI